jgi:ATP-binding cassette, subfamily C, bacterial PrsD
VSFTLNAGAALGIVGPSGSGKSTLARALVGAWKPARGVIRLDGSTLDQWNSDALGRRIGYLPQDVELLAGSVAQNIARFDPEPDPEALIAAATAADVMDLIRMLPDGFETQVGEGGALLSGGQRQRIALARALYGNPFLVVLDEPNSNLDAQGEAALIRAIARVRARRGVAVVITHRPSVLVAVDSILVLNGGRVQSIGPRDAILNTAPKPEQKPHMNGNGAGLAPPLVPSPNGSKRTAAKRPRDVTA